MTDRHAAYIVTLARDIREDDARDIVTALRMVTGVLSVEPVVADYAQHIAEERVDSEWREKLFKVAKEGRRDG